MINKVVIVPDSNETAYLPILRTMLRGWECSCTSIGAAIQSTLQVVAAAKNTGAKHIITSNPFFIKKLAESFGDVLIFAPLIIMAFWIGLYPKPFFQILEQPVNQLVQTVRPGYPSPYATVNAQSRRRRFRRERRPQRKRKGIASEPGQSIRRRAGLSVHAPDGGVDHLCSRYSAD